MHGKGDFWEGEWLRIEFSLCYECRWWPLVMLMGLRPTLGWVEGKTGHSRSVPAYIVMEMDVVWLSQPASHCCVAVCSTRVAIICEESVRSFHSACCSRPSPEGSVKRGVRVRCNLSLQQCMCLPRTWHLKTVKLGSTGCVSYRWQCRCTMASQGAHLASVCSLLQVPEGGVALSTGRTVKSALSSGAFGVLLLK